MFIDSVVSKEIKHFDLPLSKVAAATCVADECGQKMINCHPRDGGGELLIRQTHNVFVIRFIACSV